MRNEEILELKRFADSYAKFFTQDSQTSLKFIAISNCLGELTETKKTLKTTYTELAKSQQRVWQARNRIEEQDAELAAAKADDWTPIKSVEQVEGLAAGQYQIKTFEGRYALALKQDVKSDDKWEFLYQDGSFNDEVTDSYICNTATSYKLIRAFSEPAAPAIPKEKVYMTDCGAKTAQEIVKENRCSHSVKEVVEDLIAAQERIAALEALTKENHNDY